MLRTISEKRTLIIDSLHSKQMEPNTIKRLVCCNVFSLNTLVIHLQMIKIVYVVNANCKFQNEGVQFPLATINRVINGDKFELFCIIRSEIKHTYYAEN